MARRASVTKPLSVIMAPRRSSRKVRVERFGTAWARRVSQAQRRVGIGVSMGPQPKDVEHPSIARLACKARPRSGRAVTLKWQRATKNLTPEGVDKAAETLNSRLNAQISHTAACNAHHCLQERLARWLLIAHDRAESDALPLTQEFLSMML